MKLKTTERITSWGVFFILLTLYWITVPPTVSYWDCPEYTAAAWKLEVGHPPGNPVWMLVERVVTMLAPSGKYAALLINLSSGLFTALAGMLLTKCIWLGGQWIMRKLKPFRHPKFTLALTSAVGGLMFGLSDSAWYSAVEVEVYAMSIFMTALCVWVMIKWSIAESYAWSVRWLVLLAYLFGLSVGIHQLNLLCIPALAVVWGIKRGVRKWWKMGLIFILSLAIVGCILAGMMPSSIALAAWFELFFVNTLGMPFLSGVVAYIITLALSLLLALVVTARSHNRGVIALGLFPALFMSGLFIFSNHIGIGAAVAALVALIAVRGIHFSPRRLHIASWMLTMLLVGYSAYAIIPIRGGIPSPANSGRPGNPFSFAVYQAREQYGYKPLLYGHTPYSKYMLREDSCSQPGTAPSYRRTFLMPQHPLVAPKVEGARIRDPYGKLTHDDSVFNQKALATTGDRYLVKSYNVRPFLTPELNMWFPRITSRDHSNLPFFSDWVGMDTSTMVKVPISETLDAQGNPVARMNAKGERIPTYSYRPTYLQSFKMLFGYQIGYMYFRYLMWNFSGRQNDYHSTGEVEHGNFITGFPIIDNAMLGADDALPAHIGKDNKGRNRLFMLPLLFGLFGAFWLLGQGKRGRKGDLMILVLFVMSGIAIVVYLNQDPGEARERDYSFLGSYWAYAGWIAFGVMGYTRLFGRWGRVASILPIAMTIWMGYENFDDHDRSGRCAASNISATILRSMPKDAILFVNGDNATFPLWYAQEVEGVRTDVRVVNLAYLGTPEYVEALTRDWNDSRRVEMTLQPKDYLYGALTFSKISDNPSDTIVAPAKALRALGASKEAPIIPYSRVWLKTSDKDSIPFSLRTLSKSGTGRFLDFKRLIMFDIITTNLASSTPRPVFWVKSLPMGSYAGLQEYVSEGMFARRYGKSTPVQREKEYLELLEIALPANELNREVYMDMPPAGQCAAYRAALLQGAEDMLSNGRRTTALRLALAADSLPGSDLRSYTAVRNGDTVYNLRPKMATIYRALADTLTVANNNGENYRKADIDRLLLRAKEIEADQQRLSAEFKRYVKALPPRLRNVVSK